MMCYISITTIKPVLGYDDSLDVFGIHAINGAWGAIATGFLADAAIGKIAGSAAQSWIQLKAVLITTVYSGIATLLILLLVNAVIELRVSEEDELLGLDISDHQVGPVPVDRLGQ